jgi:replicative DNA helicase
MFEKIILQNLLHNSNYTGLFLPFLKKEYFNSYESKIVFEEINKYFVTYQKMPNFNEIAISIHNLNNINENTYQNCLEYITDLKDQDTYNCDWLNKETKKWIRNSAFKLVILDSAAKLDDQKPIDDMMERVKEVFSINFDETIGNNFLRDYEKQFAFYKTEKEKFESHLSHLNLVCGGGVERKTLNMLMAPTNTGKTSALVSLASGYLRRGYNVLYITCEMSEENIRQRIDANFLKIKINDVPKMTENMYFSAMREFGRSLKSNLYVKEYPTSVANANHVRNLLDNLATKENFVPDIVMLDYLNLLNSVRVKSGNDYQIVKAISEEIRGVAVEYGLAIWSATQTNRSGDGASDLDLDQVSDSYGLPMTVDLLLAIIQTEELLKQKRQIWKNLKDRYAGMKFYKWFVEHDFDICQVSDSEIKTSDEQLNNENIQHKFNGADVKDKLSNLDIDFFD